MQPSEQPEKNAGRGFMSEQHKKFTSHFEHVPVAVAILSGSDLVYEFVNTAYIDVVHKSPEEMLGKSVFEVYPEFKGTLVEDIHRRVYQTGQPDELRESPISFQRRGVMYSGYFNVKYQPLKNEQGNVEQILVLVLDVTEQVAARKQLEEKEKALTYQKQLLETVTSNAALALFLMDDRQHCIYMNEAAEKMTGFKLHELQGKQLHYYIHHTHPDGRPYPLEECPIDRALPQKQREQGEEVFVHKDGSFYHVAFTASPIEVEGVAVGTVIEVRDITEEKKAAEALRESERRFRTLAETLPQLVWMTDKHGRQEYASSRWEEYTGIRPVDETTWAQMVHPDDIHFIAQAWENSLRTGTLYKTEVRLKSKTGEFRWFAVQAEPVKNELGEISSWIGAFSDINDQKMLNETLEKLVAERTRELHQTNESLEETNTQLRLANKELESFNYVASHDLQEPLRKIRTFVDLLQTSSVDEAKQTFYYQKINASAQRMSALIQSVLNYSRVSRSEEPFVSTDLNGVLRQVLNDLELTINEKEAQIRADKLPALKAEPIQMSQLFANLLSNSLKFSDKKPYIRILASVRPASELNLPIATYPTQQFAVLQFEDNGIGFDQQYGKRIFTLFQRLHTRQAYAGTGIGLSICRKIVENHHGYITAEGRPGEGATFWVYLPVE